MDIMYYTSPLYRTEIVNGLCSRMNDLHKKFLQHNPRFETSGGKVSLIAHSLGSVISYDILTCWSPVELYDQFVNEQLVKKTTFLLLIGGWGSGKGSGGGSRGGARGGGLGVHGSRSPEPQRIFMPLLAQGGSDPPPPTSTIPNEGPGAGIC